jgi:RNA polymerase sigma-70 factor, ECF subfamily
MSIGYAQWLDREVRPTHRPIWESFGAVLRRTARRPQDTTPHALGMESLHMEIQDRYLAKDKGPLRDEAIRLVRAHRAGDPGAVRALATLVYPLVQRWAIQFAQTGPDAQDCAHSAIERMIVKLHTYQDPRPLDIWVHTIVRNCYIDHYRSGARFDAFPADLQDPHAVDPETRMDDALVRKLVQEALLKLPARQKEVFELVDIDGNSAAETANYLGIPPETVRSNLFRARNAIYAALRSRLGLPQRRER